MYTTVIATKVEEPCLADAIRSIAAQTVPTSAVCVVTDTDDAPLPGWREQLSESGLQVSFHEQPDRGLVSALRVGIGSVTTPYVAFLDADDVWNPRKQEHQLAMLEHWPELDAVTCVAVNVRIGADGCRIETGRAPAAMFTATTFRTSTFARFGLPDPQAGHYAWLYRWWSGARSAGIRVATCDYVGLERRIHGGNSWVTGNEQAHRALLSELRRIASAKKAPDA